MTDFEYRNCLNQEIARRSHMQKELEKAMEENRNLSKQITILKQENQKLHSQALNYITSMQETENKFQEQISILKSENETLRNLLETSNYYRRKQ